MARKITQPFRSDICRFSKDIVVPVTAILSEHTVVDVVVLWKSFHLYTKRILPSVDKSAAD